MKVSIVIPCFNVSNYISSAIKSIEDQTYEKLSEVICVNDGSTDDTLKVLNRLKKDAKLELTIIDQVNSGACAARNNGLKATSGDYIQFLDADDLLHPEKIEHQVALIKNSQELPAFVAGASQRLSPSGNKINSSIPKKDQNLWVSLMKGELGNTVSNLYQKQTIIEAGLWNEGQESSQEADLMFRLLQTNPKIVFDPIINTTIRDRESGSISQKDRKGNWRRFALLRARIFEHVREQNLAPLAEIQKPLADAFHILYGHDAALSVQLYKQYLRDYRFEKTDTISSKFARLVNVVGFQLAERIKALAK